MIDPPKGFGRPIFWVGNSRGHNPRTPLHVLRFEPPRTQIISPMIEGWEFPLPDVVLFPDDLPAGHFLLGEDGLFVKNLGRDSTPPAIL